MERLVYLQVNGNLWGPVPEGDEWALVNYLRECGARVLRMECIHWHPDDSYRSGWADGHAVSTKILRQ